jgi:hypothetical protein
LDLNLCDKVIPNESSVSFLSTKIEISLKKSNQSRWKTLEDIGESVVAPITTNTTIVLHPQNQKPKIGIKL